MESKFWENIIQAAEIESKFWDNIIQAAEAKPHKVNSIRGLSGFSHPIIALGVDEARKRVVIISGESDARYAALAQADIQAAMPSVKVVMARPLAINLSPLAKALSEILGRSSIGPNELDWMNKHQDEFKKKTEKYISEVGNKVVGFIAGPFAPLRLNVLGAVKEAIQQLSLIEIRTDTSPTKDIAPKSPTFDVQALVALDPAEVDRRLGVCSIPLYNIDKESMEVLVSKDDVELARETLRKNDILQYFFPAPDHLALGFVDNDVRSIPDLIERLSRTPAEGHPYGTSEIIGELRSLKELVYALEENGYMVEGEGGIEITPEGKSCRAKVCFKPREGLLHKLSRIFSCKVELNLSDLFKR